MKKSICFESWIIIIIIIIILTYEFQFCYIQLGTPINFFLALPRFKQANNYSSSNDF